MSDDWQVGDLALCIKQGAWTVDGIGPSAGDIDTVTGVDVDPVDGTFLTLAKWPDKGPFRNWYFADRFRKIRPHQPDEEDVETIHLLNGAPVQEPA